VRQLVHDKAGNIWMGTQRGILAVCNPQTKEFRRIWDGEVNGQVVGHIMSMKTDSRQHLWIGTTHSGLYELNMESGRVLRHFSKPGGNLFFTDVIDMCFYNDTSLLLTSTGGVQILNTKSGKVSLFEYPALRTNNIKAVEKGKDNDVYLAGPTGIFRINLAQMNLYVYGQRDGLLFNIFSEGAHTTLADGRVCFGTNRNFITINDKHKNLAKNPVALVSGIRIMNQAVPVDSLRRFKNVVELTYDRNYVAIDFAAPTMMLHPNNSFLYKMEGFDKDWRIAAQYPSAEYSNLPPGKYRFMVKYRNTDGEESSAPTIIPFIIHPPFYLTWWFLSIAIGLVASVVYLLHRIRVNKLLTMEKVRIHIARDLHDDMGSTLSSINILSLMSTKALEKEPAKTKEYLSRISSYSQRMMESMDDIVWSINPLNDGMEKIVARMREVAATNLEPKDIEYRFYIDETVNHLKLDMGKRRDLFLIFKEAINNMAKYSECAKAVIHITAKNKRIIMHIEDNGCGFDETLLNDGNGLINMRKRAEDLKGRLTIKSKPGLGTELTLNIPV
jgi:two-component sensor histidine kinase